MNNDEESKKTYLNDFGLINGESKSEFEFDKETDLGYDYVEKLPASSINIGNITDPTNYSVDSKNYPVDSTIMNGGYISSHGSHHLSINKLVTDYNSYITTVPPISINYDFAWHYDGHETSELIFKSGLEQYLSNVDTSKLSEISDEMLDLLSLLYNDIKNQNLIKSTEDIIKNDPYKIKYVTQTEELCLLALKTSWTKNILDLIKIEFTGDCWKEYKFLMVTKGVPEYE